MAVSLRPHPTVPGSQVLAYGAARGDLEVPSDDLVGPIDSSDEWIRKRTGIVTRNRASKDVGVKDLSLTAAREAIEASGIELETLDAIIVSTISFPYPTPSLATLLAGELGRPDVIAYDISAACAGFCYGIGQADALIRSGSARNVLVIGAEKLSDFVSPTDRSISFLLGDGAGAAVVGASQEPKVGPTVWGSDGHNWDTIRLTGSLIDFRDGTAEWPTLEQDGRTVFRWAVWHTAQRKTVRPSCSRVGHSAVPSRKSMREPVSRMVSQLCPSLPHTVGPTLGSWLAPTTAAPAPSPSRNEMERSVGETKSESFSAPITSTLRALPERIRASAWPIP